MTTANANLIATARAAEILGCSTENVRRLARLGQLRVAVVIGRGERLYDLVEVEALRKSRDKKQSVRTAA